jgi:hypothetical protein
MNNFRIKKICTFIFILSVSITDVKAENICSEFEPTTNGCTDKKLNDNNFATDFESACVTHDFCYQTIGKSQHSCDMNFRQDLISSCESKYLKFEAWKKIDRKALYKLGTCSALFGTFPCQVKYYKDIYDWVEVAKELAERTIKLPLYNVCMASIPVYESGVRLFGEKYYDKGQERATRHAEQLSENQLNGDCPIYLPSENSNLFSGSNEDITKSLYTNILGRDPSSEEYAEAEELENAFIDWEYHLVKNNAEDRMVASLIPIIALMLN